MTRRKFTAKFKTKVVLKALKDRSTLAELAQRYELTPQQRSTWKKEFLDYSESVFEKGSKSVKTEAEEKEDRLLKMIGQLKIENDFLKQALQ